MSESGQLPVTPDPAELRYAGEDILEQVDLDGTQVAVTTHRVLVSTPDGPGRRFRSVYRPNVVAVEQAVRSDPRSGRRAVQAAVYALVLSAAGVFLDFDGLVAGVDLSGTGSLGGAISVVGQLLSLLTLLDDLLLAAGVLAGVVALAFAGVYVRSRAREFRIEVAGGDPVLLPAQDGTRAAERLRAAVRTR
jgi:hypothetical protein